MLSQAAIRQYAIDAGDEARENGDEPFVYFNEDEVDLLQRFPFPFLGDYVPDGWELVETFFVDTSGFGTDHEPALSERQFREVLKDTIATHRHQGWAITEAGQFQAYVGQYRQV